MNPSFKRLLGTVLLIATVGLTSLMAARNSNAQSYSPVSVDLVEHHRHG